VGRKEKMPGHMKRPLISRLVVPGAPDALDSPELMHLRDLPRPVQAEGTGKHPRRNRPEIGRGDAVLKYWLGDSALLLDDRKVLISIS